MNEFKSWNDLLGSEFSPKVKIEIDLTPIFNVKANSIKAKTKEIQPEIAEKPQIQEEKTPDEIELPGNTAENDPEETSVIPVQTQQFEVRRGLFGKLKVKEVGNE